MCVHAFIVWAGTRNLAEILSPQSSFGGITEVYFEGMYFSEFDALNAYLGLERRLAQKEKNDVYEGDFTPRRRTRCLRVRRNDD